MTLNACTSPGPAQIAGVKLIGSVDPRRGVLTNDEGYVLYVPYPHVYTTDGDTFQYKSIDCPFDRNRESLAVNRTSKSKQPATVAVLINTFHQSSLPHETICP